MSCNFATFPLTKDKTAIIIFAPNILMAKINGKLELMPTKTKLSVRNMGVIFDKDLNFETQVQEAIQSCLYPSQKSNNF